MYEWILKIENKLQFQLCTRKSENEKRASAHKKYIGGLLFQGNFSIWKKKGWFAMSPTLIEDPSNLQTEDFLRLMEQIGCVPKARSNFLEMNYHHVRLMVITKQWKNKIYFVNLGIHPLKVTSFKNRLFQRGARIWNLKKFQLS